MHLHPPQQQPIAAINTAGFCHIFGFCFLSFRRWESLNKCGCTGGVAARGTCRDFEARLCRFVHTAPHSRACTDFWLLPATPAWIIYILVLQTRLGGCFLLTVLKIQLQAAHKHLLIAVKSPHSSTKTTTSKVSVLREAKIQISPLDIEIVE